MAATYSPLALDGIQEVRELVMDSCERGQHDTCGHTVSMPNDASRPLSICTCACHGDDSRVWVVYRQVGRTRDYASAAIGRAAAEALADHFNDRQQLRQPTDVYYAATGFASWMAFRAS
jgi:hypothetical protein